MKISEVLVFLTLISCAETVTGPEVTDTVQAVNNRDYFQTVLGGIEGATQEIDVLMYLTKFTPESEDSVYIILTALVNASRRGLEVKVLLENSVEENMLTADYLISQGIDVKLDPSDVTTHAKFMLIDCQFLLLGSSNWTNHALRLNNEANLLVSQRRLAQQYHSFFDQLWCISETPVGSASF